MAVPEDAAGGHQEGMGMPEGAGVARDEEMEVHEDDDDGGRKRPSKRRRRLTTTGAEDADDTCPLTSLEASYKRIMLALTKPSYLLGHPALSSLRQESRARLLNLLRRLASRHDWTEAAGVLAVLLKGTRKDSSPDVNRFKYTASLEFVRHVDGDHFSSRKDLDMERLYSAWMIRAGINLSNKRKRHTREDSFLVRLEAILFQLVHGNVEAERHNVRSLMQEHEFEYHPLFNLIMGLMFYHLWYSGLPDHMRVKDSEGTHNSTDSDITASPSRSHMSSACFSNEYGYPEGRNAIFNEEPNPSFQHDSSTSVGNDKQLPVERNADCCGEGGPVKADATQPQGFYRNSAENEASEDNNGGDNSTIYMSSFQRSDMFLLPLEVKDWEFEVLTDHDEEYKNAVKYLRQAVNAKPPMLEALLPLIQLLLIGCKSKEALDELENCCANRSTTLPIRLRAKLLEHAVPSNIILLSSCFEEALKSDPTSTEILEKLLSFHRNGEYGAESLLEMIALHLDAIFPGYNTWREFALCFLKVFLYEEDRMSVFMKGSEGAGKQYLSAHYNRIPKYFVHGKSGRAWQFRCKWWLRRYFNMSILASEIAAGEEELITYKAACASHMYGRESEYVAKAYSYLKTRNNRELSSFLQEHMHNSIGFALNSERRTNR